MEKGFVIKIKERKRTILLLLVIILTCGFLFVHQYSNELHIYVYAYGAISPDDGGIKINCKGSITRVPHVYTHNGGGWRRNNTICAKCFNFPKVTFRTNFGNTPIFIYNERADDWVSGNLKKYGMYDRSKQDVIYSLLKIDPELNLIDIGANIGTV